MSDPLAISGRWVLEVESLAPQISAHASPQQEGIRCVICDMVSRFLQLQQTPCRLTCLLCELREFPFTGSDKRDELVVDQLVMQTSIHGPRKPHLEVMRENDEL